MSDVRGSAGRGQNPPWPAWAAMSLSVAVALLANLFLVVTNRGQFHQPSPVPLSPPGYVIGMVWVILFALLGAAYARLRRSAPDDKEARIALVSLIALCALYPVYTDRLRSARAGLLGVIVVLVLNTGLLARLPRVARGAARLLVPLQLWLLFATYLIVEQLRLGIR